MEIYKRGQGKVVRGAAYFALFLVLFYGCYALYGTCLDKSWGETVLLSVPDLGVKITWALVVGVIVFLGFAWLVHRYLNKEKSAEYLIETEAEMKKVSWPARKEYMSASTVVLTVVVFMALFLFAVDWGLNKIMETLGVGF